MLQPLRPEPRSGGSLQPSALDELEHTRPARAGDKRSGQAFFQGQEEDFRPVSKAARVAAARSPHRAPKKSISLATLGSRHNADGQPAPWQVLVLVIKLCTPPVAHVAVCACGTHGKLVQELLCLLEVKSSCHRAVPTSQHHSQSFQHARQGHRDQAPDAYLSHP